MDEGVTFTDAGFDRRHLLRRRRFGGERTVRQVTGTRAGWSQAFVVQTHALSHRGSQVLPQVRAVTDLDRLWSSEAGAFSVGTGAISADHLDARVFAEPCGQEGSGSAITSGSSVIRLTALCSITASRREAGVRLPYRNVSPPDLLDERTTPTRGVIAVQPPHGQLNQHRLVADRYRPADARSSCAHDSTEAHSPGTCRAGCSAGDPVLHPGGRPAGRTGRVRARVRLRS